MYVFYGVWRENHLIKDIGAVCDYLIERFDATIVFIPMVIKERSRYYYKDLVADDELCERIINSMTNKGSAILLKEDYTPSELSGLLSKLQLIIAARLHTLLLGALGEVPVIAIEYAPKIKSFMTSINRFIYSININELSQKKLIEVIDQALKERDVKNSIGLRTNILRAEMNINEIEKMLGMTKKKCHRLYLLLPAILIISLLNYIYSGFQILTKKIF
jgi:polysaccharide pyruvyl transferase WcaK-like protein